MGILVGWGLNAVSLLLLAWIVPAVSVSGFGAALIAALVLVLLNAVIRPFLILLTLPVNLLTLRLFTFFDFGNVYQEGAPISFSDLKYSTGFGMSWLSPIGPLKISMGFPLNREETDKVQRFQFQIGTAF